MPCRSPRRQYKRELDGWTFKPSPVTNVLGARDLPCGVCRDCRVSAARNWSIRSYHEASLHERNCWATLTYEVDPVTLSRRDTTLFFKNLRNAGFRFRYFGCGEYGELKDRPHYHICLFGIDFSDDRYPWKNNKGNILYRSPAIEKAWPHGHALISDLTDRNALYTAGYTAKKINGKLAEEIDPETGLRHYERVHYMTGEIIEVIPEFTIASRRPGIGHGWIVKFLEETYAADSIVMNGREFPIPKYYDKVCEKLNPQLWEKVSEKRQNYSEENPQLDRAERRRISDAREANSKSTTRGIPERPGPQSKESKSNKIIGSRI